METRPRILVTGATSGIGSETARRLAARGARVVVHGRDEAQATRVRDALGPGHEAVVADFASLADVRSLAEELLALPEPIDVLVSNAGTYELERRESADGHELTFQVNHLAPFLLTNLLLPRLRSASAARIVNVASSAHERGQLDFADLMHARDYGAYRAYADSKLAVVLFTYALARRLESTRVTANCLHPGATDTEMLHLAHPDYEGRPVAEAAAGIVCVALDAPGADLSGTYLYDCEPIESSPASRDETLQERLWAESARMVGLG
jgi:NAD(P)-dependent dehydrogenase (short-subunit alcohol dehydrogenase family)